jgi:hypothetical protein
MKPIFWITTAIMLSFVACSFATNAGPERKLELQRYDSRYFERNDTGLTAQNSYMIFASQAQFGKISGPAPTMGRNISGEAKVALFCWASVTLYQT